MNWQADRQSQNEPDQHATRSKQTDLFPGEAADGRQIRELQSIHAEQLGAEQMPDGRSRERVASGECVFRGGGKS